MAFTLGTATFTNGSATATGVSITSGKTSYFDTGTRVIVGADPVIAEVEATKAPTVDTFTLAKPWPHATGTYAFLANMTSEGINNAVERIRLASEKLTAYEDGFSTLLTSTSPTVTINTVDVVPFGYLVNQGQADIDAFINNNQTSIDRINAYQNLVDNAVVYLDFTKDEGHQHNDLSVTRSNATSLINYTCSTTATGQTADGRIVSVSANTPRIVWNDGKAVGLLNEPSSENFLLWSKDFTNAVWDTSVNDNVIANDTTSPSGQTDADRLESTSDTTTLRYVLQDVVAANGVVTFSIYIKPDQVEFFRFRDTSDNDHYFNIVTEEVNSSADIKFKNAAFGFKRVSITYTNDSSIGNVTLYLHDSLSGFSSTLNNGDGAWLWQAQFEEGYSTSDITTTTSSAVRGVSIGRISDVKLTSDRGGFYFDLVSKHPVPSPVVYGVGLNRDINAVDYFFGLRFTSSSIAARTHTGISQTIFSGDTEGQIKGCVWWDGSNIYTVINEQQTTIPKGAFDFSELAYAFLGSLREATRNEFATIFRDFSIQQNGFTQSEAIALTTLEPKA